MKKEQTTAVSPIVDETANNLNSLIEVEEPQRNPFIMGIHSQSTWILFQIC